MKINYSEIPEYFSPTIKAIEKGEDRFFCLNCKKTLDKKQFFRTSRTNKHPHGILPHCKTCLTMGIRDEDPTTFLSILNELDLPYIPTEWRALLVKKPPKAPSIFGKYVSKMRLNQFKKYTWADTENLVKEETEALLEAMRQESATETEAEQQVEEMLSFADLAIQKRDQQLSEAQNYFGGGAIPQAMYYGLTPETSKFGLTQEDIIQLKRDWGNDYPEEDYLKLEQFFQDMKSAYIIQDPVAISNARMISKMTLKMDKSLDIDDFESASKISRQLDLFIKTANLAPIQQKDRQQTTFAISQLSFLVEREGGFIPEFFIEKPNDRIDEVLRDMEEYTSYLVRGETNIAEMVQNTETILAQEQLPEASTDYDDFALLEAELLGDLAEIEEGQQDGFADQ